MKIIIDLWLTFLVGLLLHVGTILIVSFLAMDWVPAFGSFAARFWFLFCLILAASVVFDRDAPDAEGGRDGTGPSGGRK